MGLVTNHDALMSTGQRESVIFPIDFGESESESERMIF